jgi:uncharacterized membrane protein YdjX (TVP38/TMEM64 family)
MMFLSRNSVIGIVALATILLVGASYFYFSGCLDLSNWIGFILNQDTHPLLFIGLMLLLPMMGFPISVFLVLAGLKFGIVIGMIITALMIPLHLVVAYLVAGSWLRTHLVAYLDKKNRRLPQVPASRVMLFTFVFMVVPSLPYAVKNYILPLSGVPLRHHLTVGWAGQLTICIPFIGLGGSMAQANYTITLVCVVIIVAGYIGIKAIKRRLGRYLDRRPHETQQNDLC